MSGFLRPQIQGGSSVCLPGFRGPRSVLPSGAVSCARKPKRLGIMDHYYCYYDCSFYLLRIFWHSSSLFYSPCTQSCIVLSSPMKAPVAAAETARGRADRDKLPNMSMLEQPNRALGLWTLKTSRDKEQAQIQLHCSCNATWFAAGIHSSNYYI